MTLSRLFFRRRGRAGIALVSVLIIVALIAMLILGFFVISRMELTSSRYYSASAEARLMADTAVNLVRAQINQATSQGSSYAWASQPGAIRVYGSDGSLYNVFKLYSAQKLITSDATSMNTAATAPGVNDMPPADWSSELANWVDLNAPAYDSLSSTASSSLHYPIFDPRNSVNVVDGCTVISPGSTTAMPMPVRWLYVLQNGEILAPDAGGNSTLATFTSATTSPSASDPIVGRIAFWTDDETCKVNINTAGGDGTFASGSTDPSPIARANFWDTPHYNAADDNQFARSQPVAGEFQRYPGHPATVALNNILNELGWTVASTSFYNNGTTPGLTPRYAFGGSQGDTVSTIGGFSGAGATPPIPLVSNPQNRLYSSVAEMLFQPDRTASAINGKNAVTRQRVEAARFFLTAHSQVPEVNLFGEPRVSMWPVWSLAPAVTVKTNTYSGTATRTTIDNLLSFASTVNGNGPAATQYPYYFVRGDPTSGTTDIGYARNQVLMSYLDTLTGTSIPGTGGNFQTKYTQTGARQILTEIFDYIRLINAADTSQPFVNGINAQEYDREWGDGSNPSATSNSNGWYQVAPTIINNTTGDPSTTNNFPAWTASQSAVNPGGYQGFGAYPRLNEIAIQFVAMGQGTLSGNSNASPIWVNGIYSSYMTRFGLGDSGADPNGTTTPVNQVVKISAFGPTKGKIATPGDTVAVEAFILLEFTNPAQMFISDGVNAGHITPYLWAEIKGLNGFQVNGHTLGFPADDAILMNGNMSGGVLNNNWDCLNWAMGIENRGSFPGILQGSTTGGSFINPFYSAIIPVAVTNTATGTGTFTFTGAPLTVTLYDGGPLGPKAQGNVMGGAAKPVQTYTINFGQTGANYANTLPLPVVNQNALGGTVTGMGPYVGVNGNSTANTTTYGTDRWQPNIPTGHVANPNTAYIWSGDTVQSMVLSTLWSDARLLACASVPPAAFQKHPVWAANSSGAYSGAFAYSLFTGEMPYYSSSAGTAGANPPNYVPAYTPGVLNPNVTTYATFQPYVPPELSAATDTATPNFPSPAIMDWDTGIGCLPDGPWINKVDEGNTAVQNGGMPYYVDTGQGDFNAPSLFSPNHEVPSPVMLGSLSTGVDPAGNNPVPWRTLLFRPSPVNGGSSLHFGGTAPKDHYLLDLFWMPIEEPYAISEPFTSAGKINLNYQIEPFTYITRSTALRAVLNSEKVAAVSTTLGKTYKVVNGPLMTPQTNTRFAIDIPTTLAQFDDKFNGTNTSGLNPSATPDIFHCASQICDMYLVPLNPPEGSYLTASAFAAKWYDGITYGLVGDNVREKPYANIYGNITTKSNSYTVYYTVQSLKNAQLPAQQNQWNEGRGAVVGEYRGSTTIERYIDPNQVLPDFALHPGAQSVDGNLATSQPSYYNWRCVENHQFAP